MKLPHAQLWLLVASLASFDLLAARAPVDERQVDTDRQIKPVVSQQQTEMFYKIQELQEEVRQLRGLIEEMTYQLDRLKQRQEEDYLDLDRRVSSGSGATNTGTPTGTSNAGGGNAVISNPVLPATEDAEKQAYNNAQTLLKGKQFEPAQNAFNRYIQIYPQGKFVPNSYYWLGQIYTLQGQLDKARQAFSNVVDNHPGSNKALDSALKLGKVYHRLGDTAKAKALLEKIASGNTAVSAQARQYIDDNLQ